jgi:hypothetical protein
MLLDYMTARILRFCLYETLLTSDFRSRSIEVQINEKGKIINVSRAYWGRKHDYINRKSEKPKPQDAIKLADSGNQGLQKRTQNVVLPVKKIR